MIVTMAAFAGQQIQWSNSVGSNPVDLAFLKNQILLRFSDIGSANSEVFLERYRPVNFDVQSSRKKHFPRRLCKNICVISHADFEMSNSIFYETMDLHRFQPSEIKPRVVNKSRCAGRT